MNADRLRIAQIDQYPECIGTVVDWIVKKWSTSSPEEVKQMLLENKECPPALVAVFDDGPVAVLAYKLHRLAQRDSVELWVNALYVASPWRGQGVGSHILCEGVKGAASSGRTYLYVYTDIPSFYERLGWRRFSYDDGNAMHVLEIRAHDPPADRGPPNNA